MAAPSRFYEFVLTDTSQVAFEFVNALDIAIIYVQPPGSNSGDPSRWAMYLGIPGIGGSGYQFFDTEAEARAAATLWRDRAETAR